MKKEILPYYECPSFVRCFAPICPLDPDIKIRSRRYPEEEKCRANKPTRVKIGKKYPELLPYQGLTKREWNGKRRWEALTDQERMKIATQGAKRLKSFRNHL